MLLSLFHRFRPAFVLIGGLCLALALYGCGDDTGDTTEPDDDDDTPIGEIKTAGLDGDTYRNTEFLFKLTKLPADDWTIEEVSNLASYDVLKAWKAAFDPGTKFNKSEDLLLLEPAAAADFADTLMGAYEAQIPYIFLQIEEQTATDFNNPRLYAQGHLDQIALVYAAEQFEVGEKLEFMSRDRMPGYSYEIRWLEFEDPETGATTMNVGKAKEAYFMRSTSTDFVYHLSYWAPEDMYEEYIAIFDDIVTFMEFNAS